MEAAIVSTKPRTDNTKQMYKTQQIFLGSKQYGK